MVDSVHSPSWYRVASLRPRVRSHLEIHRHHYRDELWYVLQDHASGRFQRFTPAAYQIIGLMDGERTVQEIWDTIREHPDTEAPTQEEVVRLLSQLHAVDALQTDVIPNTSELLKRYEARKRTRLKASLRSPLFVRFPLLDPERFLSRTQRLVRPLFGWPGMVLWLVIVSAGVFQAVLHWPELTENVTDRILAPANLVILWLTFPFLKVFHELGHAFAVKVRGGEVHEMGIMLLVFTPIPYVDASAASAFREKRERVLVGVAGMAAEVFCACIALLVWINLEPGTARSVAYNIIFIAGVSSLLFNGNPLLRYDAYYILSDLVEIPNMGPRGIKYLGYLFRRYLLGTHDEEPPVSTRGERAWFIAYSVSSYLYRVAIYVAIILFVASKFFFVGLLFAGWSCINMFVLPAYRGIKFLFTAPRLERKRTRAAVVCGTILTCVAVLILLIPIPLSTRSEGVVWVPEQSFVRARTDGFIERVAAEPGTVVKTGDLLFECSDPLLPAQIRVLTSRLHEQESLYDSQVMRDRVQAEMTKERILSIQAELNDAQGRAAELSVRSRADGLFVVSRAVDLPGRFVRRGELLGYVLDHSRVAVRTVVAQSDVDLVRRDTREIDCRFAGNTRDVIAATMLREIPAATDQLPGRALAKDGGGEIAIDPSDVRGNRSFEKIFLFDIELPDYSGPYHVGGRVYVRFDHGGEPVARRWYRGTRRLFLRRFNV